MKGCAPGNGKPRNTVNKLKVFFLSTLCALCSCALFTGKPADRSGDTLVREHPVILIPMEGEITQRSAEISGLAWYGDDLVLLPQRPERFSFSDDGALFVLSREDILAFLAGTLTGPLSPRKVPLVAPGIRKDTPGYDGYESIAFQGDRVYMTMKGGAGRDMMGYLVTGRVDPEGKAVVLDPTRTTSIPPQANLDDMCDKTVVVNGGRVITLYEANGEAVNPAPAAHVFRDNGDLMDTIPFPVLEYRITDATAPDETGRFWVINSFFWGDRSRLRPRPDSLRALYGAGPSHSRFHSVERLVEFSDVGGRVERTRTPPMQLELIDDLRPRNWEGLVRLEPHGFLLATDTFPETLLAFVPAGP